MICHQCGKKTPIAGKPGRSDLCSGCGAPLRCCLNCRFYDEKAHHQCREPQAEWVRDKATANFCDEFVPSDRPSKNHGQPGRRGPPQAGRPVRRRRRGMNLMRKG